MTIREANAIAAIRFGGDGQRVLCETVRRGRVYRRELTIGEVTHVFSGTMDWYSIFRELERQRAAYGAPASVPERAQE